MRYCLSDWVESKATLIFRIKFWKTPTGNNGFATSGSHNGLVTMYYIGDRPTPERTRRLVHKPHDSWLLTMNSRCNLFDFDSCSSALAEKSGSIKINWPLPSTQMVGRGSSDQYCHQNDRPTCTIKSASGFDGPSHQRDLVSKIYHYNNLIAM